MMTINKSSSLRLNAAFQSGYIKLVVVGGSSTLEEERQKVEKSRWRDGTEGDLLRGKGGAIGADYRK